MSRATTFFDSHNPIFTRARFLPASKINNAHIQEALISDGCIISNATIQRSLIGVRSVIEAGCYITDSVIMGSDYYNEQTVDDSGNEIDVPLRIGTNSRIHRTIIDKNCLIGNNVVIDPRSAGGYGHGILFDPRWHRRNPQGNRDS